MGLRAETSNRSLVGLRGHCPFVHQHRWRGGSPSPDALTGARVRFDALFTGGARFCSDLGAHSVSFGSGSAVGASGTRGFVGGSVGLACESSREARFTIGAVFFYEADIGTALSA